MSDQNARNIKRHDDYFLRDGNVCFLIEDTLFCLHRHFFERESEYFRRILNLPSNGQDSIKVPHVIEDLTSDEFAQFVWVWYNPRYSFSNQDKSKWVCILRLSSKWGFDEIRTLAIRQLEDILIDPIEKIVLYKEYSVDHKLLIPCYASLCRRKDFITAKEGDMLSMTTVLSLANVRELAISYAMKQGTTIANIADEKLEAIVVKVFKLNSCPNERVEVDAQVPNTNGDSAPGSEDKKQGAGKTGKGRTGTGGIGSQ